MSDIQLNEATGDLDLSPFDLQIVTGLEFVAQRLRIRLDIQKGEWFLDLREGLPYRDFPDADVEAEILVRGPNLSRIGALFQQRILSTPEVTGLREFDLAFDNESGLLTLEFEALTPFGAIVAEATAEDFFSITTTLILLPVGRIA